MPPNDNYTLEELFDIKNFSSGFLRTIEECIEVNKKRNPMQQLTLFEMGLDLPVKYVPGFLPTHEADALFTHCKSLAWQQNQIRMLGKTLPVPRLECMYGIDYASYLYSGSVDLKAHPWTPQLLEVRDFLVIFSGHCYRQSLQKRSRLYRLASRQ
jgi:alkylated DNA repair dioxygenase AlkB